MDYQNKKRSHGQLYADVDHQQSTDSSSPRFLLKDSIVPNQTLSKLSLLLIDKVLVRLAGGPKLVKKLKSGSLRVEVEKAIHAKELKMKDLF